MSHEDGPPAWRIEPLAKHHDRAVFSCGKDSLDRYLKTQAGQDARRHVAAPFVMAGGPRGSTIFGYYTLSAFAIDVGALPDEMIRHLPRYPLVPATLLGRLAIDRNHRGQGLGELLLIDALHRTWTHSSRIAAAALVVDALDADARRFYQHFDFIAFAGRQDRLFLPMKTVARLFE